MFRWISRHRAFVTFISIFLVLCIIISISYFRGNGFVGDKVNTGNMKVSEVLNDAANGVRSWFGGLISFRSTMRENEELKDEIARLNREITRQKLSSKDLDELRELSNALNYKGEESNFNHVSAKITAVDRSNIFGSFTISAGTESGIYVDAIVIAGNGLVGRISETGNGYSKVVTIIDENTNVSFEVFRDMNIMGVINGNGNGKLKGFMLEGDAGIVEGDMLITTGIGMYPEGIEVGKVTDVEFNSDMQLMTISAKPAVNFKNLRKVMVLI